MIIVGSNVNSIIYVSRYSHIDKYEILDHNSRIVSSGITNITGYNGRINHSGLTYNFDNDDVFTYKSYFLTGGTYYLATQQLLQSYVSEIRLDAPFVTQLNKPKNTFKTFRPIVVTIYDFGSANFVGFDLYDGGSANFVGDVILNGQTA